MSTIDSYISSAAEITKPILIHLRKLIKSVCPSIEENIKWNAPSFELNGAIVFSIMAFKGHVNLMIAQGKFLNIDAEGIENVGEKSNMTGFKGIKSIGDLPSDTILTEIIKKAVEHSKSA